MGKWESRSRPSSGAGNEAFILVENDPAKIETAVSSNIQIIEGDASDDDVLQRANIDGASGLITTLTDPMNVIGVISAKMLNPDIHVVTKVEEYRNVVKLEKAGVDEIVDRTEMGARAMATKVRNVAIDLVCGVDVSIREAPYTYEYSGEVFCFHSAKCMERFKENSKQFMVMKRTLENTRGLDLHR